jgi:hypothetical protein
MPRPILYKSDYRVNKRGNFRRVVRARAPAKRLRSSAAATSASSTSSPPTVRKITVPDMQAIHTAERP